MYTTTFKLFRAPRNRNLKRKTWIAHTIWNYFLGWQRTRYSLGLPYMSYKFGIYSDRVTIMGKTYRFNLSRPIFGNIKTVTIKEDSLGDFYMSVVTDHVQSHLKPMSTYMLY